MDCRATRPVIEALDSVMTPCFGLLASALHFCCESDSGDLIDGKFAIASDLLHLFTEFLGDADCHFDVLAAQHCVSGSC